jgi:hypothetical protein
LCPQDHGRWGCWTGTKFLSVKLLDYAARWPALEASSNPFAIVVLAQLKALETRKVPAERHAWKLRLAKGLYERGMTAEDVRQLCRFIDWMMDLPKPLEQLFRQEMQQYQEERRMPYMISPVRLAMEEALLKGIEAVLDVKCGAEGLQLMPEIRALENHEVLDTVLQTARTATTLEDVRRAWAPGGGSATPAPTPGTNG